MVKAEDQYLGSLISSADYSWLESNLSPWMLHYKVPKIWSRYKIHGLWICLRLLTSHTSRFKSMSSRVRLAHKTTKFTLNCDTFNINNSESTAPLAIWNQAQARIPRSSDTWDHPGHRNRSWKPQYLRSKSITNPSVTTHTHIHKPNQRPH